ncbi:unnamed protein product [Meloidogyne enterolobii]|uniref:Uncharacterized protein n=1 Tax=Meloidogyne enterolobii TaxID=390850 RepID=A0ACB0XNH7_MELEN
MFWHYNFLPFLKFKIKKNFFQLSLGECSSYPSYPPLETTFRQPVQCSSFSPIQEDYDNNFDVYNRFDEENFDVLAGEDLTPEQQPESSNGNVYPFSFF